MFLIDSNFLLIQQQLGFRSQLTLAELQGRHTGLLFEQAAEMCLVFKPTLIGDLTNTQRCVFEEFRSHAQPFLHYPLGRCVVKYPFEFAFKSWNTFASKVGVVGDAKVKCKIALHDIHHGRMFIIV